MTIMKIFRIAFAVLLLSSGLVYGATAPETTAAFYEQLRKGDFEAAAGYFDPPALTEFRQSLNIINDAPPVAQAQFRQAFFGEGATAESIAKLSDADFFSSFLRTALAQAKALGKANFDKIDILGEVMEGPDVAHVVVRNRVSVGEMEVEGMEVVSCKKRGDEWKLLVSTQMQGLANQLRAALTSVPR
jgi:hypothetical protein